MHYSSNVHRTFSPTGSRRHSANKFLHLDNKTRLLSLFPQESHFTSDHLGNLSLQVCCESDKVPSKAYNDPLLSPDRQTTITIPVEIPFKRPPLTILDLSNNNLKTFPREIILSKSLYLLNLSHNNLTSLPDTIFQLFNLEVLNISSNHLKMLPRTFSKLCKLRELYLENNRISSFGQEITDISSLQNLNIIHNHLESFPTSFNNLKALTAFSFEWFTYVDLAINQNGVEGQQNIEKIRVKCSELCAIGASLIRFPDFLRFFTSNIADISLVSPNGGNLFHRACYNGDISVVRYLLDTQFSLIDNEDGESFTPLSVSLLRDHTDIAELLLEKGANYKRGGGSHGFPLFIAVKKGNLTIVKALLKLGEDPNRRDGSLNTPLHHAVMLLTEGHPKAKEIVQAFIDYGADPNLHNRERWTPLHLAIRKKDSKALQWLLSYNFEIKEIHGRDEIFDINKRGGPYKWTALHIATYANLPDLIEILTEAGADVFKRSLFGFTPKGGISKAGIALKLSYKAEKEWIKRHLSSLKRQNVEEAARSNLKRVSLDKRVRRASKNKFGESEDVRDPLAEGAGYLIKKLETLQSQATNKLYAPRLQSFKIANIGDKDLMDTLPMTEPSFRTAEETSARQKENIFSEVEEDLTFDPTLMVNAVPNFIKKNKLFDRSRMLFRKDKDPQSIFKIEINKLKYRLLKEPSFGYEFCQKEVHAFQETLLVDEMPLLGKLRIIQIMKSFHNAIVDYIYPKYPGQIARELFPLYISREIPSRTPLGEHKQQTNGWQMDQLVAFHNLVPAMLVSTFKKVKMMQHERAFVKIHICKVLGEIPSSFSIKFLSQVVNDPEEELSVKQEAQSSIRVLQSQMLRAGSGLCY